MAVAITMPKVPTLLCSETFFVLISNDWTIRRIIQPEKMKAWMWTIGGKGGPDPLSIGCQ
jgi:hypothetical protein